MNRNRVKKIIIAALAVIIIVCGILAMRLLMKVGSIRYLYNYMNDTDGSLAAQLYTVSPDHTAAETAVAVPSTEPSLYGITEKVEYDGNLVEDFERRDRIDFDKDYIETLDGATGLYTFRGNYMRNLSAFGQTHIEDKKLDTDYWTYGTGKVLKSDGIDYWSGNGWTGQPITVKWDAATKKIMNLYDTAKHKEELVEIIYPGMDGWIHFLDIDTGEETRPAINAGMTFKGTASLYPGGIPLLFCGSGDAQTGVYGENVCQRFYIYSLIDGTLLYQGGINDEFAPRIWHAYDSSPIIHAATDTLIYPGENGVIYTLKLNTDYDIEKGTIAIAPSDIVKYTFDSDRYSEGGRLWGSEDSAVVYGSYLFIGDNSGLLYCLDLNKMSMVWAQDLGEDINSSPILEIDDMGNKYLYAATTLKYNYNEHHMGEACIYKIKAMTGEIIWKKPYEVHTVKGLAGGILSTGVVGKGPLENMVIYSVSKTPEVEGGYLVALDKKDGSEIWCTDLEAYSWSSTVCIYADDTSPYLLQGCFSGDLLLIDARTGEILDKLNFGSNIEATPVVYGNRIVLATRSEKILSTTIK